MEEGLGLGTPHVRGQGAIQMEEPVGSWPWEEGARAKVTYTGSDPRQRVKTGGGGRPKEDSQAEDGRMDR